MRRSRHSSGSGGSGMMVDFFDHDDQETVEFAEEILQAAARHHILIHFHGIWKPTGWQDPNSRSSAARVSPAISRLPAPTAVIPSHEHTSFARSNAIPCLLHDALYRRGLSERMRRGISRAS